MPAPAVLVVSFPYSDNLRHQSVHKVKRQGDGFGSELFWGSTRPLRLTELIRLKAQIPLGAEQFCRSVPVPGHSSASISGALEKIHASRPFAVAAPEDGRTPTPHPEDGFGSELFLARGRRTCGLAFEPGVDEFSLSDWTHENRPEDKNFASCLFNGIGCHPCIGVFRMSILHDGQGISGGDGAGGCTKSLYVHPAQAGLAWHVEAVDSGDLLEVLDSFARQFRFVLRQGFVVAQPQLHGRAAIPTLLRPGTSALRGLSPRPGGFFKWAPGLLARG
jgi:hypothetical protein